MKGTRMMTDHLTGGILNAPNELNIIFCSSASLLSPENMYVNKKG